MKYLYLLLGSATFLYSHLAYSIPNPPSDGETPASISCIYGLVPGVPGCPINGTSAVLSPNAGSGIIVVTEGGDDANAYNELSYFSSFFGLRVLQQCNSIPPTNAPCFQSFRASDCTTGGAAKPATDIALIEHLIDIEWAHAMAPNASIYMVEAESLTSMTDALPAVQCGNQLLAQAGGGIMSNSWSFNEFPNETHFDQYFQTPNVIYLGSSGDYLAPARYPAASPYLISAGGTSIQRNAAGMYTGQVVWFNPNYPPGVQLSGVSGGPSKYESRPSYQNSVQKIVGKMRGTPDISFVGDPRTGLDVFYCTTTDCPASGVWIKTGGTSIAAPSLAGIINVANTGATSTAQQLQIIYDNALKHYHEYWTDITSGNNGYPALRGYDFTSGLGTPIGYQGFKRHK